MARYKKKKKKPPPSAPPAPPAAPSVPGPDDGDCYNNSLARARLHDCLRTGEIPLDSKKMSSEVAFKKYPEFAHFDGERLFSSRLSSARRAHRKLHHHSTVEAEMLRKDRLVCPRPSHNHWGEPQWEGSAAQTFLKQDLEDGTYKQYATPHDFWLSREAYYKVFTQTTFRNHIYQQKRFVKLVNWRKSESALYNKDGSKK